MITWLFILLSAYAVAVGLTILDALSLGVMKMMEEETRKDPAGAKLSPRQMRRLQVEALLEFSLKKPFPLPYLIRRR